MPVASAHDPDAVRDTRKPDEMIRRRFTIYKDRETRCWRWQCTYCWPPARGARFGRDAFARIVATSMPHHFRCRAGHHEWFERNQPRSTRP